MKFVHQIYVGFLSRHHFEHHIVSYRLHLWNRKLKLNSIKQFFFSYQLHRWIRSMAHSRRQLETILSPTLDLKKINVIIFQLSTINIIYLRQNIYFLRIFKKGNKHKKQTNWYFWINSEPTTRKNVADVWLATAFANNAEKNILDMKKTNSR